MKNLPITDLTEGEIAQFIHELDVGQIAHSISQMSTGQIGCAIVAMSDVNDPHWRIKIRAAISAITDRSQLEECGRALNLAQALEIFLMLNAQAEENKHKLAPLLVGMPAATFAVMLKHAGSEQLQLLKSEVLSEPLLHHLVLFCHTIEGQLAQSRDNLQALIQRIETLPLGQLSPSDRKALIHIIDRERVALEEMLTAVSNALALAWKIWKEELIQKLGSLKESCQRILALTVGSTGSLTKAADGLYALVDWKLSLIYGNSDGGDDPEALKDHEPAVVGLTKLGIWYPEDFCELGLLSGEITKEQMNDPNNPVVMDAIVCNLQKIGLVNVGDLKRNSIFSKNCLTEYIHAKEYLLQ